MAGTIKAASATGLTLYANILNSTAQRWNGSSFESFDGANYTTYDVALTEQGTSGIYTATFPSTIEAGTYECFFYRQAAGTPAQGDIVVGTSRIIWDGTSETTEITAESTIPKIKAASASGRTVYAIVLSRIGQFWNNEDEEFEDYLAADYTEYDIAMTEQGSSGIYTVSFPSEISEGTYEFICKVQLTGTPAETDPIVSAGKIVWGGLGTMTGLQFRNYVVREFKRTDKDTEIYEATSDTVREIRRRFPAEDDQTEQNTTDTIGTLGEFKLDLEDDFGLQINDVVLVDDDYSCPLNKLSKAEYDRKYPDQTGDSANNGIPEDYCIYQKKIYLGPHPDKVTYLYRINFSADDAANIVEESTSVPYVRLYREIVRDGVLKRLYKLLNRSDLAEYYSGKFEIGLDQWEKREKRNQDTVFIVQQFNI